MFKFNYILPIEQFIVYCSDKIFIKFVKSPQPGLLWTSRRFYSFSL